MKKFRSLSQSLTYHIVTVVLVMIAVITGIVYYHVSTYMVNEAQDRYEGVLQRDHEEFRLRLSEVEVAMKNNFEAIELDIDNPEKVVHHLERVLLANPTIITCGVLYKPGYFPNRERCLELVATHDSAGVIHRSFIKGDHSNYINLKWFVKGITKGTPLWSEAYFEDNLIPGVTGRRQLTTYYLPVHDKQGNTVALMCADLLLDFLRNEFLEDLQKVINRYEKDCELHSYNFVIAHDGTYIFHPDEGRILHSNFFDESKSSRNQVVDSVVVRMMKGEQGAAMAEIEGIPSWIYYRTVKNTDLIIAIVVPQEVISHKGRMLNTIILMVMLIGLVAIYFISRQMIRNAIRPLHSFALSADEVAKGNFSYPLPVIKSSDEVRILHDSFEIMQNSLSIYVDEVKSTAAEKAAFENEMANARDIQMNMVPNQFPPFPDRSDIDIYGVMEPAKSVGGDLYDFFIRDNRLFFCIGDVSGKGMPAALLMAVTRSLFHSISMWDQQPDHIMWRINRVICEGNKHNMFVTMFIGILDLETGHMVYCNAGHEAPFLANRPLPIKQNLPVGALSDWNFEGQEADMQPGDTLFLYTDGLSEAKNQTGKRMGRVYVAQLVSQFAYDTAQQLVQLMAQEVHRYAAEAEQSDDITLLAIKWNNHRDRLPDSDKNYEPVTLNLHTTMDEINRLKPFIMDVASHVGIDPKESKRLRAAVEEAVANVINHGHATAITLKAEKTDGQLVITIDDDGLPFDPTQGSATNLSIPPDQRPPGGMGIHMIQQMTDRQSYQRSDGHNILKLFKNI